MISFILILALLRHAREERCLAIKNISVKGGKREAFLMRKRFGNFGTLEWKWEMDKESCEYYDIFSLVSNNNLPSVLFPRAVTCGTWDLSWRSHTQMWTRG